MTIPNPANRVSVLLIGGPDAGKSNFLFRLWIALSDGGGILQKDGLPAEAEYLQTGADRLLEGELRARPRKCMNTCIFH